MIKPLIFYDYHMIMTKINGAIVKTDKNLTKIYGIWYFLSSC